MKKGIAWDFSQEHLTATACGCPDTELGRLGSWRRWRWKAVYIAIGIRYTRCTSGVHPEIPNPNRKNPNPKHSGVLQGEFFNEKKQEVHFLTINNKFHAGQETLNNWRNTRVCLDIFFGEHN